MLLWRSRALNAVVVDRHFAGAPESRAALAGVSSGASVTSNGDLVPSPAGAVPAATSRQSRIARLSGTVGKVVLFFVLWLIVAIIPIAAWDGPGFLAARPAWQRLYWEVVPLLMTLALTYVFARVIDKRSVTVPMTRRPGRDTLLGLTIGLVWIGIAAGVLWAAGFLTITGTTTFPYVGIYALALLANTWTQELLVHGYLFAYLRAKHSTVAAVVVTTVLFAGLHAGAFSAGVLAVINVLASGLLFALLLLASGGLWLPVVVHFIWNLLGGMMLGQVSLGDPDHWLTTTLTGPTAISGGDAQLEGSAITLITTLLLCAIAGLAAHKTATPVKHRD